MHDKLNIYWIDIDIVFNSPMPVYDQDNKHDESVYGAIMEVGITDDSEENAKTQVTSMISNLTDWDSSSYTVKFERIGIIDKDNVHSEIYTDEDVRDSLLQDPLKKGIWYKTGFGFYNEN